MKLYIGNKKYSSWSLRPWILMKINQIPFEEKLLMLYGPESHSALKAVSPTAKLPVLEDGQVKIWESLAICEYLADSFPEKSWWPADLTQRAYARAISCEMHAGFQALRSHLPMNCAAKKRVDLHDTALASDIDRVKSIWKACLSQPYPLGPFLFGPFGIADAMFAPVVLRFNCYEIEVGPQERAYMDAVLALPAMQEWIHAGRSEAYTHEPYNI